LLDNPYDWLNDYYPISRFDRTKKVIDTRIQIDQIPKDPALTRIFRITVRNSNVDKIEAFTVEGLKQIFDYTQWHSTKRNQHRMTAGSLGDYLKRHAGMAYASWNNIVHNYNCNNDTSSSNNDEDEYSDIRWEEPIIFRFNGKQYNVFVYYNRYSSLAPESIIKYAGKSHAIDYTEVECTLPVSRATCNGFSNDDDEDDTEEKKDEDRVIPKPLFDKLYRYYSMYKIGKAITTTFSLDMRYNIRHIHDDE
jgi:hypothetical protein